MAASKRTKGPARWLILGLSGLATAGFLGAILNGPRPSDASPAPAASPAQVSTPEPQLVTPSISSNSPAQSQAQPIVRAPRFRSRAS